MARGVTYVVFILPVVISFIFGAIVLADILQEPGRELNFAQFGSPGEKTHSEQIQIIGLDSQYSVSDSIEIQLKVSDQSFSCGDLYVTIFTSGKRNAVTQSGYFQQCFNPNQFLPLNDKFSEIIDTPGNYELVVDLLDKNQKNSITTSGKFTVK